MDSSRLAKKCLTEDRERLNTKLHKNSWAYHTRNIMTKLGLLEYWKGKAPLLKEDNWDILVRTKIKLTQKAEWFKEVLNPAN